MKIITLIIVMIWSSALLALLIPKDGETKCSNNFLMVSKSWEWHFVRGSNGEFVYCDK